MAKQFTTDDAARERERKNVATVKLGGSETGTMTLWHYTSGIKMRKIAKDGCIRPATALVPKGERPIVWFSSNHEMELTSSAFSVRNRGEAQFLPREEAERVVDAHFGGLWRIGVDESTAPHGWNRLVFLSRMHPATARGLEDAAKEEGADPSEWFGTFHPATSDKWTAVQRRVNGVWRDADVSEEEEEQAGYKQRIPDRGESDGVENRAGCANE